MSNGCGQVEALREQTAAMDRQTEKMGELIETIREAVEAVRPAAEAVADLGSAQKKLCEFIVKHRVKILLGVFGVATAVGAISPAASEALTELLAKFVLGAAS